MPLSVGEVVDGTVTGITNFGAFIQLPEGKSGLVHISEISQDYVEKVSDCLKKDQKVKVKVLSISPDGKISLSISRQNLRMLNLLKLNGTKLMKNKGICPLKTN